MRPLLLNEFFITFFISTVVRIKLQRCRFFLGRVELDRRFKINVLRRLYALFFELTSCKSDFIEIALVSFDEFAANFLGFFTIFVLLS